MTATGGTSRALLRHALATLAYRGAKVVLQAMPAGFMHQRTFEALASGAFVLARFTPSSFHLMPSIEEYYRRCDAGEQLPCAATVFPGQPGR